MSAKSENNNNEGGGRRQIGRPIEDAMDGGD
jgi:hypothetical protein